MQDLVNKEVELSLKYGVLVPCMGLMRSVGGVTLQSCAGSFLLSISRVSRRGSWIPVKEHKTWIKEDCVVSRTFVEKRTKQRPLF
jgi:hypothetical protein